jgi:hypothetical protein
LTHLDLAAIDEHHRLEERALLHVLEDHLVRGSIAHARREERAEVARGRGEHHAVAAHAAPAHDQSEVAELLVFPELGEHGAHVGRVLVAVAQTELGLSGVRAPFERSEQGAIGNRFNQIGWRVRRHRQSIQSN